MKKILENYKIILAIIFFLLTGIIFYFFYHYYLTFPDSDLVFLNGENNGKTILYPEVPVTQIFTAKENNLNGINVGIGNIDLKLRDSIKFELANENCDTPIETKNVTYFSYLPKIYYRFNFSPITNSQDKVFCLKLSYLPKNSSGKRGDFPNIATSSGSQFEKYSFFNHKNPKETSGGTLAIKPAYGNGNFFNNISMLEKRMSQYKPSYLKESYLAFFALISIILIAILTIILIFL